MLSRTLLGAVASQLQAVNSTRSKRINSEAGPTGRQPCAMLRANLVASPPTRRHGVRTKLYVAHLAEMMIFGESTWAPIRGGKLDLGTWQRLFPSGAVRASHADGGRGDSGLTRGAGWPPNVGAVTLTTCGTPAILRATGGCRRR